MYKLSKVFLHSRSYMVAATQLFKWLSELKWYKLWFLGLSLNMLGSTKSIQLKKIVAISIIIIVEI